MQYNFNYKNKFAANGTALAIRKIVNDNNMPVIICIGSDCVSGDSLGPMTGTLLKRKLKIHNVPVLGCLETTITAKEIKYLDYFIRATLKDRTIITVDAAVGKEDEVGLIRISDTPLKPGSGLNKNLGEIGKVNIQGVVAEKTIISSLNLNNVRMNMIYKMADVISESISDYIYSM